MKNLRKNSIHNVAKVAMWIMDRESGEENSFSTEEACEALGLSEFEFRQAIKRIQSLEGLPGIPTIGRCIGGGEDA